jgi:hypothetical protein
MFAHQNKMGPGCESSKYVFVTALGKVRTTQAMQIQCKLVKAMDSDTCTTDSLVNIVVDKVHPAATTPMPPDLNRKASLGCSTSLHSAPQH